MNHALTRRGFLALSGAALLSGCASPDKGQGGVFRAVFAGGGAKETLDPHAQNLYVDQARHKAMFDKLFELGDDLAPVPRLASDFESTSDATVWRIRLREALFHDGATLTADDVLFSLARVLDPAVPGRIGRASLSVLDLGRCRAVDPRTVELVTSRPAAELPALLAVAGTAVVRAGFDPGSPVGTGPFRFGSFTPGRELVARRFAEHWEGAPLVDELHVLSADTDARGNAVRGGQADYAHDMTPTFARAAGSVQIIETPGCTTHAIAVKTDQVAPDVIRALKLLADRQRMVDVVLAGRGVVGNDLFGKGYRYYPDLPQRPRDVDEARSLLRKAGALNTPLELYTSSASPGFVEAATLFAEQAGEAGLRVDVVNGPAETYFKDQLTTGALGSHRSGAMPIPEYLTQRLLSSSAFNATAWKRPDFDAAFAAASAVVDPSTRTAQYGALQRILHDEGGLIAWGHPNWINAVAPSVRGVVPAPPNTLNWARFDRVSFA
ncbi:ABC transporter substrate-binding protein [Lentzea tibetensis]|uniref:ABC transporter substrate-binding protein n=1 Tax=Lentzea tibetensis TaxID=2591470 RepID=A0A563F4M6_9PSEU|nr:ABC transporter substrate-binding protein [Lentzea tibetensis]TWP54324.1 ABC transporter substrate-binding protein [Lentzea tibetensis]